VGLLRGPLKLRIEAEEGDAGLLGRARRDGIVLAGPGEAADLVARIAAPGDESETGRLDGPSLPPREIEILGYLADGWSNAEIASVLGIGVRTVRFHLENLYAALGVGRRGEAVREGARLGLIRFDF
jgi:DNA-binding CsgD family transcriptional regulator